MTVNSKIESVTASLFVPAISVVIPLYNKENDVHRAIESILAQSHTDYEVVVVDDGSTDRGPECVASYSDPRIRMIRQQNAGVSVARNRGIEEARAELVAFLDADDEWKPQFLETVLRLRKQFPSCSVFATSYLMREAWGSMRPSLIAGVTAPWEGVLDDYFALAAVSDPPVWTSAVAIEKKALLAVGGFPAGVRVGEDLLTWARLALNNEIAFSTYAGAVFWMPEDAAARPGRFKESEDVVGIELAAMLGRAPERMRGGLRRYLGRWHEMRAVIALQRNRQLDCFLEVRRTLHFAPLTKKLLVVSLLACLPGSLPCRLYHRLKKIRSTQEIVQRSCQ